MYISVWDIKDIWNWKATWKSNKTKIAIGRSLCGVKWGHITVKPEVPFWLSIQLFWGELLFGSHMYLSHWKDIYYFWYQGADPPMGHWQCFFWKFQQKFQHATPCWPERVWLSFTHSFLLWLAHGEWITKGLMRFERDIVPTSLGGLMSGEIAWHIGVWPLCRLHLVWHYEMVLQAPIYHSNPPYSHSQHSTRQTKHFVIQRFNQERIQDYRWNFQYRDFQLLTTGIRN